MEKTNKYFVREEIIKCIRDFFYKQNFHEIIPALLNKTLPAEPNLKPFITTHVADDAKDTYFLAMSPERGIKKMLAQGIGNCFSISKAFRNYEKMGSLHLNEFTMLEWYRVGATDSVIMGDLEKLMQQINKKMGNRVAMKEGAFPRLSLNTLFKEKMGISLEELLMNEKLISELAAKKGYKMEGATWEELYDQLFVNEIESSFSLRPFFLTDFPTRISPLCASQKLKPLFAQRFELYIHKMEIGNGNTENTDVIAVRKVFEQESKKTGMPIDEEFLSHLSAMKTGSYAGVGVGIDRLTMLYTNTDIFV